MYIFPVFRLPLANNLITLLNVIFIQTQYCCEVNLLAFITIDFILDKIV